MNSIELEIIQLLTEAEEENLPTVFNTILVGRSEESPPRLLSELITAVEALERQGYVRLSSYRDGWVEWGPLQRDHRFPLESGLFWDASLQRWRWDEAKCGYEAPIVTLTARGAVAARRSMRNV
jgi:hypothetical protein